MKKVIGRNDQVLKKEFPKMPKVSEEIDDIFEVFNNMPNYAISFIERVKCFNKIFQGVKTLLGENGGINTENLEQYTNLLYVAYGQMNLFFDLAPFTDKLVDKPTDMINYALLNSLLKNINERFIKTMNRGEEEYKNLIKDNPGNALTYFYYALFLKNIRKDFIKANDYFNKALILCSDNSKILCGYAGFFLSQGKYKVGFDMLDKIADSSDLNDQILLECSFYTYCHTVDKSVFFESLTVIKELLKSGTRLLGHNLIDNIEKAIKDGHPNPDFLEILSKVIVDEAKIEELNNFDVWK
jgi:tetratricopeptide (TPR) repeat protein